ncbi:LORF2 protein, partial [Crocuta crocuta]
TINTAKNQYTEWRKIFANHMSDKWLITRVYKDFLELDKNKLSSKWAKDLIDIFPKKDILSANKLMGSCSKLLVITTIQIKTTMRYY